MMEYIDQMLKSGGMWLIPALIMAMVVMQGVKAVLKDTLGSLKSHHRKWIIFITAFGVGYGCGWFLLVGEDSHKWSVLVGLFNPFIYFTLVQYAVAKEKMVLLSVLKMRPLRRVGDVKEFEVDQTVTFMSKDVPIPNKSQSGSVDFLSDAVTKKGK